MGKNLIVNFQNCIVVVLNTSWEGLMRMERERERERERKKEGESSVLKSSSSRVSVSEWELAILRESDRTSFHLFHFLL